jgi:hypothetical protein
MIRWVELRVQRQSALGLLRTVGVRAPAVDLVQLAQALGVEVVSAPPVPLELGHSLALLQFDASQARVVLSCAESERRRDIALATCLGHLMMSPEGTYRLENLAPSSDNRFGPVKRFAAELLMPSSLAHSQQQLPLRFGRERRRPRALAG